jgi:hypothetical protein
MKNIITVSLILFGLRLEAHLCVDIIQSHACYNGRGTLNNIRIYIIPHTPSLEMIFFV